MMDRKRVIFEKVLALVRNELWDEPLACSIVKEDVADILKVANEQAVSGLVANAIIRNRLMIGEDLTLEVCGIRKMHENTGNKMNAEVAMFAHFLNKKKIKYAIIKGQTMAALYPNPLMRTIGDIDFYCPQDVFCVAQEIIEKKLDIVMGHDEKEKHDTFRTEGVEFEMHRYLTRFSSSNHWKYWKAEIERNDDYFSANLMINGEKVTTLSPTLNALFIFVHLFQHFTTEGEGLKHLCDWALVLHREKENINVEELKRHLKELGYLKAYRIMGCWLVHVLGLPRKDFPLDLNEGDKKWLSIFSNNILKMGNLGKTDKKNAAQGRVLLDKLSIWVAIKQAIVFCPLAPSEILKKIPQMILYSAKLRMSF